MMRLLLLGAAHAALVSLPIFATSISLTPATGQGLDDAFSEGFSFGTAVANSFPLYGPIAYASATGAESTSASATYQFEVEGPLAIPVPIDISGFVFALERAPAPPAETEASASVDIFDLTTDSSVFQVSACEGTQCAPTVKSTAYNTPLTVIANSVYQVQLNAVAWPDAGESPGTLALAIAGSSIRIDPSFNNCAYTLDFSDTMSSAPEPSTLGPVVIGLLWLRRRR